MKKCSGSIDSIESFSTKDGPGIRTVVFLNGCNLRCKFCHNPEMFNKKENNISPLELVNKIKRFKSYYGDNGGVTFSGGEPLLQVAFLIEVCSLLKKENINLAIETSGAINNNYEELLDYVDLIILDIKAITSADYKEMTGLNMDMFNTFLSKIQKLNKKIWIRHVIIPGINDNSEYILKFKNYINKIKNVEKIELLPYHTMAIDKYEKLNLKYRLDNNAMDKEECKKLDELLK